MTSLYALMKWDHKINIKQFLSEDASPEGVRRSAVGVRCELNKLLPHFPEDDYEGERLRNIQADLDTDDVDEFNGQLYELYCWADQNLVWLGLA